MNLSLIHNRSNGWLSNIVLLMLMQDVTLN